MAALLVVAILAILFGLLAPLIWEANAVGSSPHKGPPPCARHWPPTCDQAVP